MSPGTKYYVWDLTFTFVEAIFPDNTRRGRVFEPLKDAVFGKFVEHSYLYMADELSDE